MAARPATTRAGSVTDQDQNQNTHITQIRTRSQLALPEFNVDYDRSPLKNAREALCRANARYGLSGAKGGSSSAGGDGDVDTKMAEVMARSKTGTSSNPFRKIAIEKVGEEQKDTKVDEATPAVTTITEENKESSRITSQRRASNPFDFTTDPTDEHPKYPKRPRSPSFDEPGSPSQGGSEAQAGGNMDTDQPPAQGPRPHAVEMRSNGSASTDSDVATTDPTPSSEFNPKRAKLGGQATLHSFFSRPSVQSKSTTSKTVQPLSSSPRRIFSEAQSSDVQDDSSTSMTVCPKTPTVKELQAIKTLDLRTVTPSPKKRPLQIGLGTPGAKTPLRTRSFSVGSALARGHPSATTEDGHESVGEIKEVKRAASEPREEETTMSQPSGLTQPRTPSPSRRPLLLPETRVEARSMDIDEDSGHRKNVETEKPPLAEEASLPTITVSTSTSTVIVSSISGDSVRQSDFPPEPAPPAEIRKDPTPCTPRDKILPSRSLPLGHLPSAKSNLSNLISMSPLTPLSALAPTPGRDKDGYEYEEEERTMQEDDKRTVEREAARRVMQEEEEIQDDADAPTLTTGALFPAASPAKPSPIASTTLRKASNKCKQKGKALSSTSRTASGTTGIKRRSSLIPTTPRMRLTRAAVLRQKAIQAQMRTPKDKGRQSSILPSKAARAGAGKSDDEKNNKEPKEKKKTGPETQRSPRKTFVLTVPSSLSPRKAGSSSSSASASANSSVTLKSAPLNSGPSKPFTFSLYPPSLNDTAATEQAQRALNKLSSALDKLAMPPPSKANLCTKPGGGELKRPASERRERIRPATSLGFTREMSVPVSGSAGETGGTRATNRAGSVEPAKRFLPPPPPSFGSSLIKDRSKGKTLAKNAARTAPTAPGANSRLPPPSSFRFGLGSGGVFGRPIPRMRASQKTSLETVQGSPIKGGIQSQGLKEDEEDEITAADGPGGQGDTGADADASASSSNANGDTSMSSMEGDTPTHDAMSASGKELKRISKLNASRRASMAFTTLAQSLQASPPSSSGATNNAAKEKIPTETSTPDKANANSSSRPVRAAAPRSFGFGAPGLHRTQSESATHSGLRTRSVTPFSESDSEGPGGSGTKKSGGSMGRSKMPGSLDILDKCTVFVDVRTEEGEDAGALFVDMLRGLGAKVLSRVGQTCTHIVYKNGLSSTVTRYRLLDEPKPKVVGIGWVVECAEKRARVDESRFQVDLESVNVAGTLKRRRSFLPKQISTYTAGPMDAFLSGSTSGSDTATVVQPVPKACADSDVASEDGDTSQERVLSGGSLSSSIHPLERARRRSVMITR